MISNTIVMVKKSTCVLTSFPET